MQSQHTVVLNTLQRVQRFMDANADALGTLNTSGYRKILDEVVDTLGGHAVNQATSKRVGSGETARQRVLRNALKLNHMRPIAAVAAAQLKQVPEFTALKMPPTNSTSRQLIAAAGAMGAAAANYSKTFVDAGLAPDFLAQLRAAAAALEASITNRGTTQTLQTSATAGLRAEAMRGRETVRVLDSLIEPKIAGDTVLLVQWKAARRFIGKAVPIASTSIDAAATPPRQDSTASAAPPSTPTVASTPPATDPTTTSTAAPPAPQPSGT